MVDANKLWSLVQESFPSWNFGIIEKGLTAQHFEVAEADILWFNPRKKLLVAADPFLFEEEGITYIFFEKVAAGKELGNIAWCTYDGTKFSEPQDLHIGAKNLHYSYPFLFRWENNIYLTVENYATNRFMLYQCKQFPQQWEPVPDLFSCPVVDPTIFVHEGKLWLFYTIEGTGHAHSRLYLRYADRPEGPWLEHPMNPIKDDVTSARPAGALFIEGGKIYRPAQDCSLVYGHHVVLNEVTKLSTTEFEERKLQRLGPLNTAPYTQGLHTVNGNSKYVVVDARRICQQPRRLGSIASIVMRRALGSFNSGKAALSVLPPSFEFLG